MNVYRVRLTRKIVKHQTVVMDVAAETAIKAGAAAVGQALHHAGFWDSVTPTSYTYKPHADSIHLLS